jgi:hypothetical protein
MLEGIIKAIKHRIAQYNLGGLLVAMMLRLSYWGGLGTESLASEVDGDVCLPYAIANAVQSNEKYPLKGDSPLTDPPLRDRRRRVLCLLRDSRHQVIQQRK